MKKLVCLFLMMSSVSWVTKTYAAESDNPDVETIDCMANEKVNYPARPVIKNGTFYIGQTPVFLVGPWVDVMFNSDNNSHLPIKGYENDPAYHNFLNYEIAGEKGFVTYHPQLTTWFTCKKLAPNCPRLSEQAFINLKDYYPTFIKNLKELPIVVDYAKIRANDVLCGECDRNIYGFSEDMYQKNSRWHAFVPFCPENPKGWEIYKTYWLDGVRTFLGNGGNPWIYELFNEPAYDCRCKYNKENFIKVLKEKYGNLDNVNKKWGTAFKSFEEIVADSTFERNKGLWVDWLKFIEDRWCEILREGMKIIRAADTRKNIYFSSQRNIVSTFLTTGEGTDEYKNAQVLDVVNTEGGIPFGKRIKNDDPMEKHQLGKMRLSLDCCRAAAEGKPVIDTEQDTRRFDENHMRIPSKRGDLTLMLWNQAIHGSSLTELYSWSKRSHEWPSKTMDGAKEFVNSPGRGWSQAMLLVPYNYPIGTLDGIKDFNKEIKKLADIVLPQPRIKGEIALLLSNPSKRYTRSIEKEFTAYYDALESTHCPMDVIFEEQINKGLAKKYKAIISPYCHYTYDETAENLRKYVEDGGVVILQGMDLCFDEYGKEKNNNKLLGLASRSPINTPVPDEITLTIPVAEGYPDKIESKLSIKVAVDGAEVLSKSKKNIPQITRNSVGKGKVYYNACKTDGSTLTSILAALLKDAGIKQPFILRTQENKLLPQVEAQIIDRGDTKLYYFANWDSMSELGTLRLCDLKEGNYYLSNPAADTLYLNPEGKETWTGAQLNKGVTVFLPGEERVLLLLTKEKPSGITSNKDSKNVEQEYKTRRAEDEIQEKALEKIMEKARQAYIQRNKFLDAVKEKCFPIDISKHCNMGFEDDVAGDGKGGGFDHGGNNDLREFPVGKQEFSNVPFSIIDPAKNNGKSIIVLRGHGQDYFPLEVKGIPINRKAKYLYFIHTIAWEGKEFGYTVNYDEGTSLEIPIRGGKEVGDWWNVNEKKAPLAKVAWTGKNDLCANIGAYCYRWENPKTDKTIKTLDMKSCNSEIIPAIIGITGEE